MSKADREGLGPDDTVLCTATMGFRPLRDFIEAAGRAGFSAISLSPGDYKAARRAGASDADLRAMLADAGLVVADLDGIVDWLNPLPTAQGAGYDLSIPFFGHTEADFFDVAAAVGARSLNAVDPFFSEAPVERMADAFGALCDRAARHGLLVHLEFLSWGPVSGLATAWDVVRRADRRNGGLLLDALHLARSDSRELLRSIPGEKIFATQLCDGRARPDGERYADAANRLLPGEGELDVVRLIRDLDAMGCRAPLGVEVMNADLASRPAADVARLAHAALTRVRDVARFRRRA